MAVAAAPHRDRSAESRVLAQALLRAAALMDLPGRAVSEIVGISASSFSRIRNGKLRLDPAAKEGQLALLLLRVFRSVDAIFGSNNEAVRGWLRSENRHLAGVPLELLRTPQGLVHVADYLDAMRGKL